MADWLGTLMVLGIFGGLGWIVVSLVGGGVDLARWINGRVTRRAVPVAISERDDAGS